MNKRRINIILIVASLSIWGWVSLSFFDTKEETNIVQEIVEEVPKMGHSSGKKFVPKLNYQDPFLRSMGNLNVNHKLPNKPLNPKKEPVVIWPDVKFYGVVKNKENSFELALLEVDRKAVLVGDREEVDGISTMRFNGDSITLEFRGETMTFYK